MKLKKLMILVVLLLGSAALVACGETTTTTTTTTTANVTTEQSTTTQMATTATTTEATVDLLAIIDELKTQYADTLENENFLATDDLVLVDTVNGIAITWTSNNETYLENDGTIHRPTFVEGDQTVVLTATLTDGDNSESYGFFVTVKAMAKTAEEIADEVFVVVTAFPAKEKWTTADNDALDFVTSGQDTDGNVYEVSWVSSDPDLISVDGTIVQPVDADTVVTMTATVTVDGKWYTKAVDFTVAKVEDGVPVTTIAAGEALGADSYVEFQGMTVTAIFESGAFFFTDGVDIMYVYTSNTDVEVGGVYDITGVFVYYYNAPELIAHTSQPVKVEVSAAAASTVPVTTAASINDIISGMTTPSSENPFQYQIFEVTAKVYYNADWGNYSVFLVPTDYDFNAALADGATQPNGDSIMIYYQSNDEVLQAFHGKEVTLQIQMAGWRTDKSIWYANYFGDLSTLNVSFADDAEAVSTALATLNYPGEIMEATTLNLPASALGVSFSWTSSDAAIIDPATGIVDLSTITNQTPVTLTVTATKGTVTDTKEIVIKVGELVVMSIADAIAEDSHTLVKIVGVITDTTDDAGYGAFWVQDSTGAFDLFNKNGVFTEAMIGHTYEIIGEVDVYNGLHELVVASIEDVTELTGDDALAMPAAVDLSAMTLDDTTLLPYQGMLVDFSGYVLKYDLSATYTSSFNMVFVNSAGEQITVRADKDMPGFADFVTSVAGSAAGTAFDFTNLIVGWYNGAQLLVGSGSAVAAGTAYTDQQLFDTAVANLSVPEANSELTSNLSLPTTGLFGSTIVWTSTDEAVIALDGTVTRPANGSGNATVTLSYVLTLGSTSTTAATIDFTVLEAPVVVPTTSDLFISEYGEGSSSNKWIEIYNPTDAAIDLTGYVVGLYSNGSDTVGNTYTLTDFAATLDAGATIVIYNSSAVQAVIDAGDVSSNITYFNGDDAVALLKDDVVIDVIGVIGEDPGSSWVVGDGSTANHTLVRDPSVTGPTATFDPNEWIVYDSDTFTYIGTHTVN